MVGAGVLPLDLALFIILGANIGTCVTALLASVGANSNSKRVALIHFTFNAVGTIFFTALIWIFREPAIQLLTSVFPGGDPMSVQMRVSLFHVIFNVSTTLLLLPFVKQLVAFSSLVIRDKRAEESRTLRFVDERMLAMPSVALGQVKKEMEYMLGLAYENTVLSFAALLDGDGKNGELIAENEAIIDFTNGTLTRFLIKLSPSLDSSGEATVGAYFHVLNDLERIGDHAENFYEIGAEMKVKGLAFSEAAVNELGELCDTVKKMFDISKDAFENLNRERLTELTALEERTDEMKRTLNASHFARLAEGNCSVDHSPYFSSTVVGLERVADHLVNVGYSILNPTGSQKNEY
jgi:phosphate:Na+ symporter